MFKGTTKPNRIAIGLWAFQGGIAVTAAFSAGVTWAALPSLAAFLCPFSVFTLSFFLKQSYWKLELLDYICAGFSLLALTLWYITQDPKIAISLAILTDLISSLPVLKKSWTHPETETAAAYSFPVIGFSMSFFIMESYNFAEMAFPVYSILICASIAALIYSGRWRVRTKLKTATT